MDVISFYNERWDNFSYINKIKLSRSIKILDAISNLPISEPKILDLGCGSGWLSSMLGLIGPTTGVDLSDLAIVQASERYPHVKFIQADLEQGQLILSEEKFDIVVSQEVIEHIENQQKFINLIYTLLKPEGYLIITTPNRIACDLQPKEVANKYKPQPIENWLTVSELKTFLRHNFYIVRVETFIHNVMINEIITSIYLKTRNFLRLLRLGFLFDLIVFKLGLGLHIFVLAQKKGKV